jgi:hypothetical protein
LAPGRHGPPGRLPSGAGETPTRREALRRFQMGCQIRSDKFNYVLPEVMRENKVDMWIVTLQEQAYDPLYDDLGRGYPGSMLGYYVFTDRGGDRIERAALGIDGYMLEECGVYDIVTGPDLAAFVKERDPKRIALNYAEEIGAADGLSHSSFQKISKLLGETYVSRFMSAEKLVSDFRSRTRGHRGRRLLRGRAALGRTRGARPLERGHHGPGKTTLADVAWWLQEELLKPRPRLVLRHAFGLRHRAEGQSKGLSNQRIVQRRRLPVHRLGRVPHELLHRRQAAGLRPQGRRDRAARRAT